MNSGRGGDNIIEVSGFATSMLSLEVLLHGLSGSDLLLVFLILLGSSDQLITAFRRFQVRHRNVYLLFNNSTIYLDKTRKLNKSGLNILVSTHQFIDFNTNGPFVDIEYDTSTSMVKLKGHALVNGGIYLDINIIASLKVAKISSRWATTLGPECLLEKSACMRSVTERVRHTGGSC
jgi:hypothetical protein